jgi:hypothetical protein
LPLTHWDLKFKCCTCISSICLCVGMLNTCTNNCKCYLKLWNFALVDVSFGRNECAKILFECAR